MRKARCDAKKSVASMAVRLGVTAKTINNYETGRSKPSLAVCEVWAQECNAEWLRDVVNTSFRCILLLAS